MEAFDPKEWLSSLKNSYPDLQIAPEIESEIVNGHLRQSDYDRKMNKLKQEHAERMAQEDEFHDRLKADEAQLIKIQTLEQQFGPAETWSDALAQALSAQNPDLNLQPDEGQEGGSVMAPGNGNGNFSLEEVQQMLAERDRAIREELSNIGTGAAVMIDFMSTAPEEFKDKYGKRFPKQEFSEFFSKSGTKDPYIAFQLFERPFAEEKAKLDRERELEEARAQERQSVMSKYGHVEAPVSIPDGPFLHYDAPRIDMASGQPQTPPPAEPSREAQRSKVGGAFVKALASFKGSGNE